MLQWVIMFVSREQVVARWLHPTDRVPEYPAAVDRALRAGQRVAIVGRAAHALPLGNALRHAGYPNLRPRVIADTFFILLDPSPFIVQSLGFQLGPEVALPASHPA